MDHGAILRLHKSGFGGNCGVLRPKKGHCDESAYGGLGRRRSDRLTAVPMTLTRAVSRRIETSCQLDGVRGLAILLVLVWHSFASPAIIPPERDHVCLLPRVR